MTNYSASRRSLLTGAGAVFAWAYLPKFARAGGRDPRLIVIILRGALDGLSAVAPVGDPDYLALHGSLALSLGGDHAALPLDSFFALNPAMPVLKRLYDQKQAAIIHAVASPYRDRSHFDGQDVLESGYPAPGFTTSGWLNRALAALPKGGRVGAPNGLGLGIGAVTPLVLRGSVPVLGWAPQNVPHASGDLTGRLLDLYAHRDPALGDALSRGLEIDGIALRQDTDDGVAKHAGYNAIAGMRQAAKGAASLMAADTHANEGGATGRLAQLLGGLDGALEEIEKGLGPLWKDTAVAAVTEFGRTARIYGTTGTDHGTGTIAFLAGGAIAGGRVIADWPGLKDARLYQNRDLAPTTDLRAALKGMLTISGFPRPHSAMLSFRNRRV